MPTIAAVSVNHNTSPYMELLVRSLWARHRAALPLALTSPRQASTDDTTALQALAAELAIPFEPSGFGLHTQYNSHSEILRRWLLEHPAPTHSLFLDADVCFVEDDTVGTLLTELEADPTAFGIGPRLSWDGMVEIPATVRAANPDICDARLHPCCALVRNTPLFRTVVDQIGLGCVSYLWAERAEYLDTFKLMTRVMATHGLRHIRSSALVQHFFCVSYDWDATATRQRKARQRDRRLAELRAAR
jgi:hypothetical protein